MDASIWLKDNLPQNSVIAGQWAPQLSLETKFRAVPLWKGFVNDKEPFRNYGITHIISWEYPLGNELELQRSWYPEQMANAEKLKAFTIKESIVSLWSLNPGKEVSLPQSQVLRTTEHQDVPDQHYPATGSHDN